MPYNDDASNLFVFAVVAFRRYLNVNVLFYCAGTLQCIMGKRGLPRLIVDGHTFFKKSTYKNKCFWYCKTNRAFKCPAVCWTVNGRIVKWPEGHNHGIVPEVITPGEDTIVPIESLRQVLIDAAR